MVICPACSEKFTPLNPDKPFHTACKAEQTLLQQSEPPPPAEKPFETLQITPLPDTKIIPAEDRTLSASAAHFVPLSPAEGGTPKSSGSHGTQGSPGGGRRGQTRDLPDEVKAAMENPSNHLGNYIIIKQVGKGGMGAVYRAWDPKLARFVAIKFLLATEENDILRFQREAQLSAALRHPNIAPVYEFGEHTGRHYLVMEYIDGSSLERMKMTAEEIIATMIPVCQAVDYAHNAGVIHRDLKPQNIMLTTKKLPFVMDFGLAKQVEGKSELSASGMVVGTPAYMPPEQAQGWTDQIDRRSDVYSLGATLYFMMTNVAPFKGPSAMDTLMMVIKDDPVAPRRLNPAMPIELEIIALKAMAKEPERRYQTAGELGEDLRRFSQGESIRARPPSLQFMMTRSLKRNPFLFLSIGLALVVVGVFGWFQMRPASAKETPEARETRMAREWIDGFTKDRSPLQRSKFQPKSADNPRRVETLHKTLAGAGALLPKVWESVVQWYLEQADTAGIELEPWKKAKGAARFENSAAARGLAEWAGLLAKTLDGIPEATKPIVARLDLIARDAELIADYQGVFRLALNPAPYATLQSLKSSKIAIVQGGKFVDTAHGTPSEADLLSPVVIADLEIDTYEAEFVHPKLGTRKFTIRKEDLQPAGDYLLSGDMSKENGLRLTVR